MGNSSLDMPQSLQSFPRQMFVKFGVEAVLCMIQKEATERHPFSDGWKAKSRYAASFPTSYIQINNLPQFDRMILTLQSYRSVGQLENLYRPGGALENVAKIKGSSARHPNLEGRCGDFWALDNTSKQKIASKTASIRDRIIFELMPEKEDARPANWFSRKWTDMHFKEIEGEEIDWGKTVDYEKWKQLCNGFPFGRDGEYRCLFCKSKGALGVIFAHCSMMHPQPKYSTFRCNKCDCSLPINARANAKHKDKYFGMNYREVYEGCRVPEEIH
uniref:Zinc finger PHD-type domain-containing protein n=1 Tax=Panagrolaimus sp. PS1159 TaxID=55785 RepID=A0AC35EXJ3_9BILA